MTTEPTNRFAAPGTREYAHDVAALQFAARLRCVLCERTFSRDDAYTGCPNSAEGGHALEPVE